MKSISFRVPAVLCALISFVALVGSVRGSSRWWQPVFYAFLPACFLYLGSIMVQMNREIVRLRRRIAKLEQKERPDLYVDTPRHSLA